MPELVNIAFLNHDAIKITYLRRPQEFHVLSRLQRTSTSVGQARLAHDNLTTNGRLSKHDRTNIRITLQKLPVPEGYFPKCFPRTISTQPTTLTTILNAAC